MTPCRRCGSALPADSHHRVRYCSAACRREGNREHRRRVRAVLGEAVRAVRDREGDLIPRGPRPKGKTPPPAKEPPRPRPVSVDSEPDRYTDEEREVLAAVDRVRRRKGWRFLGVTELLAVLKGMGYRRA